MKISLNWLKNYIDLNNVSIQEIDDKLTAAGLEVEEVIDQGARLDKFVVGYVKDKQKHPDADKLSVCVVSDGTEHYNVVCGAPNVEAGQRVAFAKVGAVVPNGEFKIKKAKIRGEVSMGMICSEDELGLSDNHDGIIVLDDSAEIGVPLAEALGVNDVVFDISVTPNRADALSHFGVARDLAALFNKDFKVPKIDYKEAEKESSEFASVEIENKESCRRFVGKVVTGIKIGESPEWLKERLLAVGSRPINNVVDVTNFLLHETGQPIHAYDLDTLEGQKIIVRNALPGEKFITLDSKERTLAATDLMICDGSRSVGIAGVMGGENTEVTGETKNILIECAYFDPSSVRKTSKTLGLSTDASYRFERGCDPEITKYVAQRCAQLVAEVAGGEIANGEIDIYPKPIEHKKVEARFNRINKVLGYNIEKEQVTNIFTRLGFGIVEKSDEKLLVDVPTFRHDIEREIDLIEEVARIYGYDEIPAVEKIAVTLDKKTDQSEFAGSVKETLAGLGFYEVITNSLLNQEIASQFGRPVKVMNPQTTEMSNLRTSLLPGVLSTISKNLKVKEFDLKLFEIGEIFNLKSEKEIKSFEDFSEDESLLITVCGKTSESKWYEKERSYDFYDLKGFITEFLRKKSLDNVLNDSYNQQGDNIFEYTFSKSFKGEVIGAGGKVKNEVLKQFDIKEEVFAFSFNLTLLKGIGSKAQKFDELLKYPKIIRDFAFVLETKTESGAVSDFIKKKSSDLLKKVQLFDIFESDSLGKGKKSLAYQLEYYDKSRTLTEEEVDKDFWNIIEKIKTEFNAELRG